MKQKRQRRIRTNPGKVIHRAHRIHQGQEQNVNLVNLKHHGEYVDERIVDLLAHLRRAVGGVRFDALQREAMRMCGGRRIG